jgi:hypothetical protein
LQYKEVPTMEIQEGGDRIKGKATMQWVAKLWGQAWQYKKKYCPVLERAGSTFLLVV